jgi:hypothetical protein
VELHRRNSASFRLHIQICAVVVVEGATISLCIWSHHYARPRTSPELRWHCLFCWLIFTLAVYALPFLVGLYVFMMALHGGAGILGAPLVGIAAGGMTLAIGQTAFAMTRFVTIRAIIAALFAVPATLAGYQVVFAMSQIGVPSLVWREIFACLGAVLVGGTTWMRLTVFTENRLLDSGRAFGSDPQPVLTTAAHQK